MPESKDEFPEEVLLKFDTQEEAVETAKKHYKVWALAGWGEYVAIIPNDEGEPVPWRLMLDEHKWYWMYAMEA